ncbi:MAG: dihydrofolate reductase [Opitutales bacterium]
MPSFKAIAAMSENRVIGHCGSIPWHLPEDFKWFKKTTMGDILLMGRKTYASIGRPLPGRETIVLTKTASGLPGVRCVPDLETLDQIETEKTIWVAGGATIYRLLLPRCAELYLTRVHRTVEGDTFFPSFEAAFQYTEALETKDAFTIERWVRR